MNGLRRAAVVFAALALAASACGGRNDSDDASEAGATPVATAEPTETTTPEPTDDEDGDVTPEPTPEPTPDAPVDPCQTESLEATDIGVTESTMTVVVMADVGSPLAPGLFQGAIDGVEAWADHVNAEGGLACRQIEVIEWDSMLNGNETTNGFLKACEDAVVMIGTATLFALNTEELNSCPNGAGEPIGVPEIAYLTTEPPHQCSPNTYSINRPNASCPYESGPRDHTANVGGIEWLRDNVQPDLHGVFLIPADLPSTITASIPPARATEMAGIGNDAEFGVSGQAAQAEYGEFLQAMRDSDATLAWTGSNDQTMIKWRSEAVAQGVEADVWYCSLSCYTPSLADQGGEAVQGTYSWIQFLPFHETAANQELADFIDAIGDPFPQAWAANAWAGGVLFEQVVEEIVAESGPNGLTRAAILERLATVDSFDANGWFAPIDLTTTERISECYILLQLQGEEFVRVEPTEPGTFNCSPDHVVELTLDAQKEFSG